MSSKWGNQIFLSLNFKLHDPIILRIQFHRRLIECNHTDLSTFAQVNVNVYELRRVIYEPNPNQLTVKELTDYFSHED